MSDNPDIKWALDILTPEPGDKRPLFMEYGLKFSLACGGFYSACYRNYLLSRPMYAGIHIHLISAVCGWAIASAMQQLSDNHYARRDQLLKDYIIKHPEDFPEPERKKWADVLEPWYPIR